MSQFALYEQTVDEDNKSFHYICSVNSKEDLQDVLETHEKESEYSIHVVPLSSDEYIPYNFKTEQSLEDKIEKNKDLL